MLLACTIQLGRLFHFCITLMIKTFAFWKSDGDASLTWVSVLLFRFLLLQYQVQESFQISYQTHWESWIQWSCHLWIFFPLMLSGSVGLVFLHMRDEISKGSTFWHAFGPFLVYWYPSSDKETMLALQVPFSVWQGPCKVLEQCENWGSWYIKLSGIVHWIVRLSIANTLTAFHQVRYKAHYWALADLSNTVCCLSHYDMWFSRSDRGGGERPRPEPNLSEPPIRDCME